MYIYINKYIYTLKSGHMLSVLLQHMYLSQVLKHVTDLDTCVPET